MPGGFFHFGNCAGLIYSATMIPRRSLPSILGAAILTLQAQADVVHLKTGEKFEGKIVSETATEYTFDVKVTASITDQKVVAKDAIEKIEKEQPDVVAWQPLKNLRLGVNSMPAPDYDRVLGPLKGFINQFPQSAHAGDAKKILGAFEEEKKRVDAGEVRIGERWLSSEEVAKERYQISALILQQQMRAQASSGDLVSAMNTFDQIEKNYPGSKVFPDAVESARSILGSLKTNIERAQKAYAAMEQEFQAGLANTHPTQKAELQAARKKEIAQGEAVVAAAEKAGLKWPQIVPRSNASLNKIAQRIPQELNRLGTIDLAKQRQSIQLAGEAQKSIEEKNSTAADEALKKAKELWVANEMVTRLQADLTTLKTTATPVDAPPLEPPPAKPLSTPVPVSTPVQKPLATPPPVAVVAEEKSFPIAAILIALGVLGGIGGAVVVFLKKKRQAMEEVAE